MRLDSTAITLKDGRSCLLRSPTPADSEAVIAYLRQVNGETDYLTRYPDEVRMTAEREAVLLQNMLDEPCGGMLCAEVDGDIAAFASFAPVGAQERLRHRCSFGISVRRAYWRQGLGAAVTARLIEEAKATGFLQMELEVVSRNAPAIALYERFGFRRYGVRPNAFRYRDGRFADEDLMVLSLAD